MTNTKDGDMNEMEQLLEKVAQLWCLPQHAHKEMDVAFATSIRDLILSYTAELRNSLVEADKYAKKQYSSSDTIISELHKKNTELMADFDLSGGIESIVEVDKLRKELERERLRLAACGVAALGYFEGCADEYKSASLDDVLRLRKENEELRKCIAEIKNWEKEIPRPSCDILEKAPFDPVA
jgi:hypothetical protein